MRKIFILLMMVNYFLYSNEEFPIVSTMPPYEELEFVSYDYFPKSKDKVEKNNQKKQDIKNINNK